MPVNYNLLTYSVVINAQGVLTVKEVVGALQDIVNDPLTPKGIQLVCDLRSVSTDQVISHKIRIGAQRIALLLPFFNNRIHLVVATALQYGLTRMYQTYSSEYGVDVIIYKSIEEAYKCLHEPCKCN